MSTLVAQTISNGTVSTSTANVINGAKAWVNFNGTGTVAIRASYNVSSITDNGTGDYTVNFTNALADANWAVVSTVQLTGVSSLANGQQGTPVSTAARIIVLNSVNGGQIDPTYVNVAIFR